MSGMGAVATPERVAFSRCRSRRIAGLALIAAVVLSGCASATATPVHLGPSATPTFQTALATPTPTARPSLTPTPEPTPEAMAVPDWLKGDFDVAMGSAGPVAPADDWGYKAGTQIDDFGLDLIRRLDTSGNVCLSPTSIAIALAMVRAGAHGQTAAEMDRVLYGFGANGDGPEIAALLESLRSQVEYTDADGNPLMPEDTPDPANPEPALELNLADAAFLQKGMDFKRTYLDSLASNFGAGAGQLDFAADPEAARKAINDWAGKQTRGRIPEALGPNDIDTSARIALANAIYLKAGWEYQFDPAKTANRTFTTASGAKRSVPTMANTADLNFVATKSYQAVDLPYAGSLVMTVVMPTDMASFLAKLTADGLNKIVMSENESDLDLTLPRFSIESRFQLADALSSMGMPSVFDGALADLSGISDTRLYLSRVVHVANIDVVEDGTTAAAVSVAVGSTTGGGGIPPHARMNVNRPFAYFIRDRMSGAFLFMGVVNDPSAK
jgi:serpin B